VRLAGYCQNGSSAISSPSGGKLSGDAGVRASITLAFPAGRQAETNLADLPLSSPSSILATWLEIAPDLARTG
jgi:hypothetical protein